MAFNRAEQLRDYQHGFEAAMQIFEVSKRWPTEERYALTDQVRRSVRSVFGNLVEEWSKRRAELDQISDGLAKMIVNIPKWCGPANLVKKEDGGYDVEASPKTCSKGPSIPGKAADCS